MSHHFTPAKITDISEIHQIFINVTKKLRSIGVMQWDFSYPDLPIIKQDIHSGSCIVLRKSGLIAATVSLNQDQDEQYQKVSWTADEAGIWVIHRLAVSPQFQNQGIATNLCIYLEELAKSKGAKAMRLDAYSENPYSNKMYQNLGYRQMKELLYFHGNPIGFYAYEKIL